MTGFSTTVIEHAGAVAIDAHVGEQAGGEQGLDGLVDFARVVGVADVEPQIGANRLRLDAAVAGHANVADGAALRFTRECGHQHRLHDGQRENASHRNQDVSASPPTCTSDV